MGNDPTTRIGEITSYYLASYVVLCSFNNDSWELRGRRKKREREKEKNKKRVLEVWDNRSEKKGEREDHLLL